jgi:hypothetical protein
MSQTKELLRGWSEAGRRHEPNLLSRHLELVEKLLYSTLFVALFSIQLKTTKVPIVPDLLTIGGLKADS